MPGLGLDSQDQSLVGRGRGREREEVSPRTHRMSASTSHPTHESTTHEHNTNTIGVKTLTLVREQKDKLQVRGNI